MFRRGCNVYNETLANKQLLDEVFVMCRIINVNRGKSYVTLTETLITLNETLIILHITKTESNNCFIMHFK